MYKVKITAVRKADYKKLQELYENTQGIMCGVNIGDSWIYDGTGKPEGLCESAWESMKHFVTELSLGNGNFLDGWMKNPQSAMISCNDGFRPVSFLLEVI